MARPGGATYPMRAIRTREHLYIRNFEPKRWPTGGAFLSSNRTPHGDVDACPTATFMTDEHNRNQFAKQYALCFDRRPAGRSSRSYLVLESETVGPSCDRRDADHCTRDACAPRIGNGHGLCYLYFAMMRGQKKPIAAGSGPAAAGVFQGFIRFFNSSSVFLCAGHLGFVSHCYESHSSQLPHSVHC